MATAKPTADAEAILADMRVQAILDPTLGVMGLPDNYREARDRFFEDLGKHAHLIPPGYPPFTEEHAEVLAFLGYLD